MTLDYTVVSYIWHLNHSNKRIDRLDFVKIKNFYVSKDTIEKVKKQPTEGERVFVNPMSDKGFVSRIYKELLQLTDKRQIAKFKSGQRIWIDISPKKICKWSISTLRDLWHHESSGKCKLKAQRDTTSHSLG